MVTGPFAGGRGGRTRWHGLKGYDQQGNIMNIMLDLISIKEAENLVNMQGATIRAWVPAGICCRDTGKTLQGAPGKPYPVYHSGPG